MPNCVQCNINLPSIDSLGLHFRIAHKAQIFSTYQCGEQNCCRTFNQWYSLKKHLMKKHYQNQNVHQSTVTGLQKTQNENMLDICASNLNEHICVVEDNSICVVEDNISFNAFETHVSKEVETFIAKLYANNFPRSDVQTFINDIKQHILDGCLLLMSKIIKNMLQVQDVTNVVHDIDALFDTVRNCFEHLSTEYKIFKYFESCGDYIPPQEYIIGHRLEGKKTQSIVQAKHVPIYGQFIALRKVLKRFFELPNAFQNTMLYMKSLENDSGWISNFIQSPLWRHKTTAYRKDDIILPLFIYYDDFEPNNPLGSHCEKLGAVYCMIPCLPPECQSVLDNIFLTLLFNSENRKWFGNTRVFLPLIEELQFLESEGIIINTSEGSMKIYFMLALLLGDNLGLHGISGFAESFNCKYPCRFCKCTKSEIQSTFEQNIALLRSKEDYEKDVVINNVALNGIKEPCVFNKIISFHITSNFAVDIMHDVLEGVCHYDILLILNHFQKNIQSFSLDILNFRLAMFDFGPIDSSNRPPQISHDHLKKNKLKMTASEMLCFVKFLGLLIADLIPEDDKFWCLYILLRRIIDIILSRTLVKDDSLLLNTLIYEHNKLYTELKGDNLKPKFHHLVHYSSVLNMSGPFIHYSSMRFEAKHRSLKKPCYTNMSRKNIAKSIAIKHQLQYCFRLKACKSILPEMKIGPGESIDITLIADYELFKNSLPDLEDNMCFMSNWVKYKGTHYKKRMVLIIDFNDITGPLFGEIVQLIVHKNRLLFLCSIYETIGHNSHVHGYEISKINKKLTIIAQENLFDPLPIYSHRISSGEIYCILRYDI